MKNGILISVEGIDISRYRIEIEDVELDTSEITVDHLLCLAADECDEVLIRTLIEKGADVKSTCDDDDQLIINVAFCKENGVALASLLLNKGADINGSDSDNDSFLSYSINADNLALVEFLIDKGADRTQRDENPNMGCLPIHGVKSVAMLQLLISKKFDIHHLCDNKRNLLHFAAKDDRVELARYLVEHRLIDPQQKDKNGETPLDYAVKYKHPRIVELLKAGK